MTPDRYFAILSNGGYYEYYNFSDAINAIEIKYVIIDRFKHYYTPYGGLEWPISQFLFFSQLGQPLILSRNGWILQDIEINYKSSSRINCSYIISDHTKKIQRIPYECYVGSKHGDLRQNDIHLVIYGISLLDEISHFSDWNQYTLKIENDELRQQNEQLLHELTKLRSSENIIGHNTP
jgi:hypothetical protein